MRKQQPFRKKAEIVSIGIPQTEEHAKSYDELARCTFC